MSAAEVIWLTGPRSLEVRSEDLPAAGAGEILCETLVSAISPGTELAAWSGQPPLRPGAGYPRVQGYCNVARVIESGVADYVPGDRVLSFASHRSRFVLPASEILYKLPSEADQNAIVCAYFYHLGYNAVLRAGVRAGSRVLVIGLGVLGLTSVAMAALAGADTFALTDHASAAHLARLAGARDVFPRSGEGALRDALGNGADVVITTVNGWDDWQAALRLAGQNGTIACVGFPGRGQSAPEANPLDSQYFYMKQLRIEAVGWSPERDDSRNFLRFNERANIAWIARLIHEGKIDPALIVSGKYPAAELARAYADLAARKDNAVTYLLDWA